ncbi:MAG: acyl-CoA thioesterase [Rhizobiaceae bacterium]
MAGKQFKITRKMRFGDCDPAGIAFYPRLVEQINELVEDWFDEALDYSFRTMHLKDKVGVPTRSMSIDFEHPAQLGEMIKWNLLVLSLGRSSIKLAVEAHSPNGKRVLRAEPILVWADFSLDKPASKEIPQTIRAAMQAFLVDGIEGD